MVMVWLTLFMAIQLLAQDPDQQTEPQEGEANLQAGLQTTDTNQLQHSYGGSTNGGEVRIDVLPAEAAHALVPIRRRRRRRFQFIQRNPAGFRSTVYERSMLGQAVLKQAIKFSSWVIGLTFGGIFSIYSGILGNQTGLTRKLPYRACTLVMVVVVLLGMALYLVAYFHPPIRRLVKIITIIKHISMGLLALTVLFAAIPLLSEIS